MRAWMLLIPLALGACSDSGKAPFTDGKLFEKATGGMSSLGGSGGTGNKSGSGGMGNSGGTAGSSGSGGTGNTGATCSVSLKGACHDPCMKSNCCAEAEACFLGPCGDLVSCVIDQEVAGNCTLSSASDWTSCAASYCGNIGLSELGAYLDCMYGYCSQCY